MYIPNEIIYYPDKHITILFDIKPKYDIGDYTITWYTPDTLTGEGPYQITLTNNLVLDFEISDDNNNMQRFQYEVTTDAIDSVTYDYRNDYIGTYFCKVAHSNNGSVNYSQDSLTVVKNNAFNMLNILTTDDIKHGYQGSTMIYHNSNGFYNSPTGAFFGYHSGASFKEDSIHYTVSGPLGAYYTNTYEGVKLPQQ
ncbi:MAG: hypothetical protein IPH45_21530 [Bacteroidales bacterium]|nr:hypothetical protein [Bacteroidales bacterium]